MIWEIVALVAGFISIGAAVYLYRWVMSQRNESQLMAEFSGAVQGGAAAYLSRLYRVLGVLALVIGLVLLSAAGGVYFYRQYMNTAQQQAPLPKAALDISSDPPGAQLFIDGVLKGRVPLRLDLPPGSYEVRLSLPDYYEWEGQIQLLEEKEVPLDVRLIKMEGE